MKDYDEIEERITMKRKNAQLWYEIAKEAYYHSQQKEYLVDRGRIETYIEELEEVSRLIEYNGGMNVTLFENDDRKLFEDACKLHTDKKLNLKYQYLAFFQFGKDAKDVYIYIPPIASICEGKYDTRPPSKDDGD